MTSWIGVSVGDGSSDNPIYCGRTQMLDYFNEREEENSLPNMKLETPSTISAALHSLSWTTIDSLQVPCFTRKERDYIPARLVEERLLSQYPSNIDHVNPLIGYHATQHEVQILNDILAKTDDANNGKTVDDEAMLFTTDDVLVSLDDFRSFYEDLKKRFDSEMISTSGGWFQINNVVVPYVYRHGAKLVPVEIVRYGAHLLTHVDSTEIEVEALTAEVDYLNGSFVAGGFSFALRPSESKLINVTVVCSLCEKKPRIQELPAAAADGPLGHAAFDDTAVIEVQSTASSADSDLEFIYGEDSAVTPILIAPSDEGDVETCDAQTIVPIENPEWGAAEQTVVAPQTQTPIPCIQSSEAIINNPVVDFVAVSSAVTVFQNHYVSNDVAAYVQSHLRNAENELRDFPSSIRGAASTTRGKINGRKGKRRNVETAGALTNADNGLGNSVSSLGNAESGLRDATGSTRGVTRGGSRGRVTKKGNPRTAEKQWAMQAFTSMASENEKEKRRLAKNAELIRMNSSSVPFLFTNANTASSQSQTPAPQFDPATMRQFNLIAHKMVNQLTGNAAHPSNGQFYDSSDNRNAQPYSGFPANDGMPPLQYASNSMHYQHNRFPTTGFAPAYQGFPQPCNSRHDPQNTLVSAPPSVATSLSNNTASEQRSALSNTASSICYGETASSGRNGLISVLPSGALPASEMLPSPYNNNTSPNGNARFSYHGSMVSSHGNSMNPDNCNGPVPASDILPSQFNNNNNTSPNGNARSSYHGNMVASHVNNMNPDNCNGPVPAYPGSAILSSLSSMTSSMSYETFNSNHRNDRAPPVLSDQIMSPQRRTGLSSVPQQNELLSTINSAYKMNNLPRYQRREKRSIPVGTFRSPARHSYPGAMANPYTYPGYNQWNQHQYNSIAPPPPQSRSPRNSKQPQNSNLLSSLLRTNDEIIQPSVASTRSPTGNPLPRSLEPQSGDPPPSQERQRQHQSLQFDYRNSQIADTTSTILAKHRSNLQPPPAYQSVVQSTDSDGVSTQSTGSSPPSGQRLHDSPNSRNVQGHGSPGTWPVAKELSNSESIVFAKVYGRRMCCLLRNNTLYILLEGIQRNFFQHCALDSWLYMLDVNCGAKTITLTPEEEAAFLECYRIPSEHLRCNRAIAVDEFSKHLKKFQNSLY